MANPSSNNVARAATELRQLEQQTQKARLLLARLQAGLIDAGNKLGGEARLLIEANQQLVLSALHAQAHAEIAVRTAELDVLTALPNRTVLLDRFEQAIAVAKRRGTCVALLFLDIDNFKHINDTRGHNSGDKVLQHVAHCLTGVVREADTVSRHGGDEFLILLTEISQISDATLIADKVHASLTGGYPLGDQVLSLTVSIGISLYPDHGENAIALIERADVAMYHAKRHRLRSCLYNGEIIACTNHLESAQSSSRSIAQKSPTAESLRHTPHHAPHAHLREANEHLIIATLDAQDQQATAEQEQRRQTDFLAILAHELRNPLNPIRMAATLLEHVGSDPLKLQELQQLIDRQVTRMTRLIDDLFDVVRVNSGKLTVAVEVIDINLLIDEIIKNYQSFIQKRRQQLIVQTPPGEIFIEGDSGRLIQVFSNLLDNASKYTPEGGQLKLMVAIEDNTLVMTFSDNGIGIVATALPHIFEPFVQDAAATGFNNEGLGIGLAVVRELIEAHQGSVTAHSAGSGLGSQFVVRLPLFIAENSPFPDASSAP